MSSSEISSKADSARRAFLKHLATSVIFLAVIIAVVDVLLRLVVPASGILQQTVDIQTPATLYLKLEELRRFEGMKVVLLGDSLIFGRTMRDKGDKDWQSHTLSSQLQRELADKYPGRPILVSNLGMNGTLPADLDNLVRIVLPLKPDLIIFDLTLRSFSRDFDAETQSRSWLADLRVSPSGTYSTVSGRAGIERLIQDQLVNHWFFYRLRDFFQSVLFDGGPAAFLANTRNVIDDRLRTRAKNKEGDLDDIVLLMRARSRYQNIDLAADNPQRQALERTLQRLDGADQPAIIFYATENPRMLPRLIPGRKFNELQGQLSELMAPASPKRVFVGPLTVYSPDNFIDHVHLNQEGYRRLSRELGRRIEEVLPRQK